MSLVLLIDDEPEMGAIVSEWLHEFGASLVHARNLDEALRAGRTAIPEAILLDLSLNGADGLDLIPELNAEPSLREVPIIAFSVHDSREPEARARGVSGFVAKPFRAEKLHAALREHLG